MVDGSGNWSLGVPASVVSGLVDGSYPVSVSVTDKAGNTGSQSLTVTVDTAAPMIGINTIAGDDVINASEKGPMFKLPAPAISLLIPPSP